MIWNEWWIKATSIWVKRLLQEERPLIVLWEENARKAYIRNRSPHWFVNDTMRRYFPKRSKGDRRVKNLLGGSSIGRAFN
jgi:hypothetical protein